MNNVIQLVVDRALPTIHSPLSRMSETQICFLNGVWDLERRLQYRFEQRNIDAIIASRIYDQYSLLPERVR